MTSSESKMHSKSGGERKQETDALNSYRLRLAEGFYRSPAVTLYVARCLAAEFTPQPAHPPSPLGEADPV